MQVRNHIQKLAAELGMSLLNQTKLMTAASEIGRNIIRYAGSGQVTISPCPHIRKTCIKLVFEDSGPGIADIDMAMRDGYSSSDGLGLGLPGTKRIADEFQIESAVGHGTKITIVKW